MQCPIGRIYPYLLADLLERETRGVHVELLVCARAERAREVFGQQAPEHQVRVGDRSRPTCDCEIQVWSM